MLTGIRLQNFKAFKELDIALKPITLFLGPNNSGKSSILAAIRLLSQTLKNNDGNIPLLLEGTMGNFGTYQDVIYQNNLSSPLEIAIKISSNLQIDVTYSYDLEQQRILVEKTQIRFNDTLVLSTFKVNNHERKHQVRFFLGADAKNKEYLLPLHSFIPLLPVSGDVFASNALIDDLKSFPFFNTEISAIDIARDIFEDLQEVEYMGAIRAHPERYYQLSGVLPSRIGTSGENTVSILRDFFLTDEGQNLSLDLKSWLNRAGIASDLKIEYLTNRLYEIRVQHPITGEYQNLADVGMGNSQVLPVLVGGFNLPKHSTYMVEEPEIHLHPRAQAELGSFFHTLYQRGVQSLVETHSEHLVVRLQQVVAQGLIPPDDVAVYYVYAHEGQKIAKRLHLDDLGRFIDEWPEGFFPEGLKEAEELSRIRFQAKMRAKNGTGD